MRSGHPSPSEIVTIRSWHGWETDKVDISKHPILSQRQEITHKANKPAPGYKERVVFPLGSSVSHRGGRGRTNIYQKHSEMYE